MSEKSITFPTTISQQAHDLLIGEGKTCGLKLSEVVRAILYKHILDNHEEFCTLISSEDYDKNNTIKKNVYLPEDCWEYLAHTGNPSITIFNAIKKKNRTDLSKYTKDKEGVKHGQKK